MVKRRSLLFTRRTHTFPAHALPYAHANRLAMPTPRSVDHSQPNAPPTRARFVVMAFALTLAMITYIDRVAVSQAASDIRSDLGFGPREMGWVFSAFALAYAL